MNTFNVLRRGVHVATVDTSALQQVITPPAKKGITRGIVNYVQKPVNGETLHLNVYTDEKNPSNLVLQETEVTVHDIRAQEQALSLEQNGFGLYKLQIPDNINWDNQEEVEERYYPLVEKLLLESTGGSRVKIFDHTLRQGKVKDTENGKADISKAATREGQPIGMAHVDYTHESGIDRLDALLPEEAQKLRETPFAVVQVWRPLKAVRTSPLGMIDASTVESSDLTPYQINFPGRTGYNFAVHHNEKHRWLFADQMQTDEAYVFVCYHSRLDRARFTPHTGFKDLSAPVDAPPRESIELRSYVFWENEEPREVERVW